MENWKSRILRTSKINYEADLFQSPRKRLMWSKCIFWYLNQSEKITSKIAFQAHAQLLQIRLFRSLTIFFKVVLLKKTPYCLLSKNKINLSKTCLTILYYVFNYVKKTKNFINAKMKDVSQFNLSTWRRCNVLFSMRLLWPTFGFQIVRRLFQETKRFLCFIYSELVPTFWRK